MEKLYENRETTAFNHEKYENKTKEKLPAKRWLFIAMIVYGLLALSIKTAVSLAENGAISEESILPGWTILLITSTLYFLLLQSHLRWYYMLRFWVESSVVSLAVGVAIGDANPIADEMTTSILASDFLCIVIIWIPYLFASLVQKQRKYR